VTDFVILTTSDVTTISGGGLHTVQFRPVQAGNIFVRSTPAGPPNHSETGFLGRVDLYRPGKPDPLASYEARIGEIVLGLTYSATDADLVPAGNWTCRVHNATEADLSFDTEISYPSTIPLEHKTATFDVTLLNLLLAEAVAASGLAFHIQSSASKDDPESNVSWSINVANTLSGSMKGQTAHWFQVDDYRAEGDAVIGTATWVVLRITGFDSDPDAPVLASVTNENGTPALQITMALNANTAKLIPIDSDIDLDELGWEIDIHTPTIDAGVDFYGNGLHATVDLSATVTVAGVGVLDVSNYINGKVQDKINGWLSQITQAALRGYMDGFFVNLMRLGSQATVEGYAIDAANETLTVSYSVPGSVHPVHPVLPVGHPVATSGENQ
jgi:hypothetical protein